jgi:catechol 2,3-dioxygenase-like lactoylglutathione lyase family enzyme
MPIKFTHVRLLVSDYKACFRFYQDVLGFEVLWGDEEGGYADFKTGEVSIALFGRQDMADAVGAGQKPARVDAQDRAALIFAVENVDETYRVLSEKGVEVAAGPVDRPDWGIRTAHFRDPDGNLIEINESLSQ